MQQMPTSESNELISKLDITIIIEQSVIDSILSHARILYPRESILLLRGKVEKHRIIVNDTLIPPLATHGNNFSTFPLHMLPIDFSIMGIAHSHPSGALHPSVTDLNKFYGRIMLITAYPFQSENDIAIFDRDGKKMKFNIL
jgi:proteasome lid subunit RPN8/RPN11